jgi:hypothetical protein
MATSRRKRAEPGLPDRDDRPRASLFGALLSGLVRGPSVRSPPRPAYLCRMTPHRALGALHLEYAAVAGNSGSRTSAAARAA